MAEPVDKPGRNSRRSRNGFVLKKTQKRPGMRRAEQPEV